MTVYTWSASLSVQVDDVVGNINFVASDGTDAAHSAAKISAEIDGTAAANDLPGRLVFATTADGAHAPSNRMIIDSSGRVLIGTTSSRNVGGSTNKFNITTRGSFTKGIVILAYL